MTRGMQEDLLARYVYVYTVNTPTPSKHQLWNSSSSTSSVTSAPVAYLRLTTYQDCGTELPSLMIPKAGEIDGKWRVRYMDIISDKY